MRLSFDSDPLCPQRVIEGSLHSPVTLVPSWFYLHIPSLQSLLSTAVSSFFPCLFYIVSQTIFILLFSSFRFSHKLPPIFFLPYIFTHILLWSPSLSPSFPFSPRPISSLVLSVLFASSFVLSPIPFPFNPLQSPAIPFPSPLAPSAHSFAFSLSSLCLIFVLSSPPSPLPSPPWALSYLTQVCNSNALYTTYWQMSMLLT